MIDEELLIKELNFRVRTPRSTMEIIRDIIPLVEMQPKVSEQEIRNKAIEEALEKSAKAICVGCAYLNGHECTYKGANCGISKPMLDAVVKALEQTKEVGE